MADLKTNYKDDVLDTSKNEKRKFRMIQNDDGTVSFDDATEYTQQGDAFGAADINATNAKINEQSQSLTEKSLKGVFNTPINSDAYGNILLATVDVVMVSVVSISNNVILSQPFIGVNKNWYTQARDINGNIIQNKNCIVTYYYI